MDVHTRQDLGLIRGLDSDTYHASAGISQSGLKLFAEPGGPAKYKAGVRKDTRALKFGGAFHTATLEPHLLEKQYAVTDLEREGTKDWAKAELDNPGRILLKRAEWNKAIQMRDAIRSHPFLADYITPELETESSFYWIDRETGRLCRGRADGICRRRRVVIDLKSTVDASPEAFRRTISDWGYDWQEYFYRYGLWQADDFDVDQFIFAAIEKEYPHLIGIYVIDPNGDDMEEAGRGIRQAMRDMDKCMKTGIWPGYDEKVIPLRVSDSRRRKLPFPGA